MPWVALGMTSSSPHPSVHAEGAGPALHQLQDIPDRVSEGASQVRMCCVTEILLFLRTREYALLPSLQSTFTQTATFIVGKTLPAEVTRGGAVSPIPRLREASRGTQCPLECLQMAGAWRWVGAM